MAFFFTPFLFKIPWENKLRKTSNKLGMNREWKNSQKKLWFDIKKHNEGISSE